MLVRWIHHDLLHLQVANSKVLPISLRIYLREFEQVRAVHSWRLAQQS